MFKQGSTEVIHTGQSPEAVRSQALAHVLGLRIAVAYYDAVQIGVHPRDEIDYDLARRRLAEITSEAGETH